MSLLSRLGAVFRPESRETESYTRNISEALLAAAQGDNRAVAERTAAVEFGVGLLARCFAAAIVEPAPLAMAMTAARREEMARRLLLTGNYVARIDVDGRGALALQPASFYDLRGGPAERSWTYWLDLPGPSSSDQRFSPSEGVVHVRIGADPVRPWQGISPLVNAGLSSALLARLELRSGEEAGAQAGYVLPVPDGTSDESIVALKADLLALRGKVALVESQSAGHGQGQRAAPPSDWRLQRMGADLPQGNAEVRRQAGADVCAALGIPAALFVGADGATVREAYRQLLTATIQPLAQLIGEELERKLELPAVRFNFRRLSAADIAARARAFSSLVQAYQGAEEAPDFDRLALLAGLDE